MNQESKTVENAPEMGIDRLSLPDGLELLETEEGLTLAGDGMTLRADFTAMIPRIRQGRLQQELLVRAAKIKGVDEPLAVDATAGFGQDSLLLAASGFRVLLFERNPVIAALLRDALRRATSVPELANAIARMRFIEGDSVVALNNMDVIDADARVDSAFRQPDVVYLDPMFPARTKSAAVKKKFQLLHRLEQPCEDPDEMLRAALATKPRKIVVKRPPKGPYLANVKPSYSLVGKAVRYDVIVPPRG